MVEIHNPQRYGESHYGLNLLAIRHIRTVGVFPYQSEMLDIVAALVRI